MADSDGLYKAFSSFLESHVRPPCAVAVAVSGGIDSMVLLHLAQRWAQARGVNIVAAHVDHGWRERSADDARFVEQRCVQWGVAFQLRTVSLVDINPDERRGVEADLRRLRYEALAAVANAAGAKHVLLAHHADDQLETMLWRLCSGTSLTGLAGIRPVSRRNGMIWLRPLLSFTKSQLQAYAHRWQIPYVEDETNLSLAPTRNYLRHVVIPRLRERFPQAALAAARTAAVLRDEDEWMERQAREAVDRAARAVGERWRIDVGVLRAYPLSLQRRAIQILLYCLASEDWTQTQIESVVHLLHSPRPSACVPLPGGWSAWREYDVLWLGSPPAEASSSYAVEWALADGSSVCVPPGPAEWSWSFTCRRWQPGDGLKTPNQWVAYIADVPSVEIRPPRTGERVQLWSGSGSKKIQDVYTDCKVPRRMRRLRPVVAVAGEVVWLPGLFRSGRYRLREGDAAGWVIQAIEQWEPLNKA
ncbi:MAG: tRNA lysidine(34) synthetase TilS [Alicyclobacillaceae bacterium]|nr:tRNA lysidine(34) synthetase TilS [Alicyclobacillaceae bacterium]